MLDIVTASTDKDLTTTSALKQLILGATATSTVQDAQFSDLIRRASRWAESYLGYPATVQSYRETLAAYGRRRMVLSRTPVRSIADLFDATDTGVATLTTDYMVEDADGGILGSNQGFAWTVGLQGPGTAGPFLSSLPLESAPLSGQEYRPWLADYVAGWTYGGLSTSSPNWSTGGAVFGTTSTERTLPEDVEQAVLFKAQTLYDDGDQIASETLGDMTTNYRSLGTDANGRALTRSAELLDPYRRVA